jgi:hypothetical protein
MYIKRLPLGDVEANCYVICDEETKVGAVLDVGGFSDVLLNEITPEIVCVCCCAGNDEYTVNSSSAENANLNNFPTQDFINRIAKHTQKVYVTTLGIPSYNESLDTIVKYRNDSFTSMNGNIVVKSKRGEVTVECSNNNTLLKDTTWFKENRTTPSQWATAAA